MSNVNPTENPEKKGGQTKELSEVKKQTDVVEIGVSKDIDGDLFTNINGKNIKIHQFSLELMRGILGSIVDELKDKEEDRIENGDDAESEEDLIEKGKKAKELVEKRNAQIAGYRELSNFFIRILGKDIKQGRSLRSVVVDDESVNLLADRFPADFDRDEHKLDRLGDGKPDVSIKTMMILTPGDMADLRVIMQNAGKQTVDIYGGQGLVFEINGTKLAFICADEIEINGEEIKEEKKETTNS